MARTPFLERTAPARVLGAAFIAILLFFIWLTYAFFNHAFESSVPMQVKADRAGLSLPSNADVKIRGMIVGSVRNIELQGKHVDIDIALKPDDVENIPAGVSAQIVPKTLFGEKYIELIPPKDETGSSIRAGATITQAEVPVEVEDLLIDLQPLLEAVKPAELNYTLSAMAEALDGRGNQLGDTMVQLNDYIKQVNPDVPQLISDLDKAGEVSDIYAQALPDIGTVLSNSTVTADTVIEKREQLAGFFTQATSLSKTLQTFLSENEDNLVDANALVREPLDITRDYSKVFPCFLNAMAGAVPIIDSAFRNDALHINVSVVPQSLTLPAYEADEHAVVPPKDVIYRTEGGRPQDIAAMCPQLERAAAGHPDHYHGKNSYPGPDPSIYKMIGLQDSHQGKFGADSDYNRPAAASGLAAPQSLDAVDSPEQRKQLRSFLSSGLDVEPEDVPDVGVLMMSTMLRGTEVSTNSG